ncbi:hypothetical protein LTR16_012340, partial [Cryomyces antarcticus]
MQVEDTKDRVYVHDIDAELADIESDEERLVFLPDVEKRLTRIPKQVLMGEKRHTEDNQELVLYKVPESLSVPQEHDSVRKAILETRERARQRQAELARGSIETRAQAEIAHGFEPSLYVMEEDQNPDPDAMDIG